MLAKTVRHFLPGWPAALGALPDARGPDQIVYPKQTMVWSGILIPLLGLGSRRQFRFEADPPAFAANLAALAHADCQTAPHDDTIVYYLEGVPPEPFEALVVHIARRLIRMKALDRWRLYGRFLVAIDGTGHLFFRRRHCPHCLTQKSPDGRTFYYHHVLEAKRVTANGFAFSLGREERPDGSHYFAWLTNTPLGCASVIPYANQGGRLRWTIENEGFRTQKHGGYELEHAYSLTDHVAKIFYDLIQIAHALNQLIIRGSLLRDFRRLLGSVRNYRRRLAEALRHTLIPHEASDPRAARAIQIRFDTS